MAPRKPAAPVVVALDFETANNSRDSACALGLVRLEGWKVAAEKVWLIRPPSAHFLHTGIHGIAWQDVEHCPSFGELWPEIGGLLKGAHWLAAHNAPFDKGVLHACLARHGHAAPKTPFLDTVHIARKVWQIFPTKLNHVCERLEIDLDHHEALSDARACARVLALAAEAGWQPER
jgi:DNA polymerase-3 subunit epsilon